VAVIEDCAQALGARIDGKPVGRQGKLAIFSFYATKMITSGGQGGMVVSAQRDVVEQIRDYRQFDCRHDRLSRFNFQMTDVQAAIGRVQLARLDEFVDKREAIFSRYKRAGLELLQADGHGLEPVRYRAVLRCRQPEKLIRRLHDAGIDSIVPIEDWELLDETAKLPNAYQLSKNTVSLPIYPALKMKEVDLIARQVAETL
jgi:perosamine synthetase